MLRVCEPEAVRGRAGASRSLLVPRTRLGRDRERDRAARPGRPAAALAGASHLPTLGTLGAASAQRGGDALIPTPPLPLVPRAAPCRQEGAGGGAGRTVAAARGTGAQPGAASAGRALAQRRVIEMAARSPARPRGCLFVFPIDSSYLLSVWLSCLPLARSGSHAEY